MLPLIFIYKDFIDLRFSDVAFHKTSQENMPSYCFHFKAKLLQFFQYIKMLSISCISIHKILSFGKGYIVFRSDYSHAAPFGMY